MPEYQGSSPFGSSTDYYIEMNLNISHKSNHPEKFIIKTPETAIFHLKNPDFYGYRISVDPC